MRFFMNKRKFVISSLVIIPFLMVALYFQFHASFKEVIHADKSVNPKATDYFAHAMLINMGEMLVHDFLFIDYDSFLFKPLHALQNNLFKEGQKYVASDNLAEEGVWWSLIHLNKYGLVRSGRRDRSLIKKELSNKKSLPMREQARKYYYAVIDEGVKGVDFGGKEFSAAFGLFVFPFYKISETYPGETRAERVDNYWEDNDNYQNALISYQKFTRYIADNPYLKGKHDAVYTSLVNRVDALIYFNILHHNLNVACGQLLDDYLVMLTRPELDITKWNSVQTKTVDILLEKTALGCPAIKTEILNTQKYFHTLKEK